MSSSSKRLIGLTEAYFPDVRSFDQQLGGYAALPWVFRTLLRAMSARQWALLTYLYLRSGPEGVSWQTDEAIGNDLGIGAKKVGPHLRKLEELGLIATKRVGRNRYVKLVDPMSVAERLVGPQSSLSPEHRARLADDLQVIRHARRRAAS